MAVGAEQLSDSLFVFSGLDGAGKSTQIDLLAERLRQRGKRVRILWARGGYTPGMVLLKKILRRWLGNSTMPASGHSEQRSAAFANSRTRWWWQTLALLDLGLYYGIWLRLQLLLGKSVICDRYLPDTQLDFQLNFRDDNVTSRALWKCLQAICPTPTAAFMLLIPVEESLQRSAVKNEPFPDSQVALQERLQFYRTLAAQENTWHVIDGLQPIDVVAKEVDTTVFATATHEAPCP